VSELDGPTDPALTHQLLRGIRQVLEAYGGDRVGIGETFILDVEQVASYIGATGLAGPPGHRHPGLRGPRRLTHVGPVEPRHPPPAHPAAQ
jgi:hypothetical protein